MADELSIKENRKSTLERELKESLSKSPAKEKKLARISSKLCKQQILFISEKELSSQVSNNSNNDSFSGPAGYGAAGGAFSSSYSEDLG